MEKKCWKYKIIRADPGWRSLSPGLREPEDYFGCAVIAWMIQYEEDGEGEIASVYVKPITIYGEADRLSALESPDGEITKYYEEFADRGDLMAYFTKESKKNKEKENVEA